MEVRLFVYFSLTTAVVTDIVDSAPGMTFLFLPDLTFALTLRTLCHDLGLLRFVNGSKQVGRFRVSPQDFVHHSTLKYSAGYLPRRLWLDFHP